MLGDQDELPFACPSCGAGLRGRDIEIEMDLGPAVRGDESGGYIDCPVTFHCWRCTWNVTTQVPYWVPEYEEDDEESPPPPRVVTN